VPGYVLWDQRLRLAGEKDRQKHESAVMDFSYSSVCVAGTEESPAVIAKFGNGYKTPAVNPDMVGREAPFWLNNFIFKYKKASIFLRFPDYRI
jgi:hypothetical protein